MMNIKQLENINLIEVLVKDMLRESNQETLLRFYDELKKHIKSLVIDRGLNKYLGHWLALSYIMLIAEPAEGLSRIKKFMIKFEVSIEEQELILKGIFIDEVMNVRGYYSEVLKDAVALTEDGLGYVLSLENEIRKKYASFINPKIEWSTNHQVNGLVTKMKLLLDNPFTIEAVHGIRIVLRKVMVLLDLMWFYEVISLETYEELKQPIKEFFNCFKQPRELDVLYDQLKGLDDALDQHIYHRLEFSRLRLRRQIAVFDGKEMVDHIDEIVQQFEAIKWHGYDASKLLDYYEDMLDQIEDQKMLHKFRIINKRYKYLYALGIITFETCFKENVRELHDVIGIRHDLEINQNLILSWQQENKVKGSVNYEVVLNHIKDAIELTETTLNVLFFKTKKCMNIIGVKNVKKNM